MNFILVLLSVFILAQTPGAMAKTRTHIATPDDQECSECHVDQASVWFNGKHGLMNVKCIVCHGSTDKNFMAKPDVAQCIGCHGEEVEQVRMKTAQAEKTCFPCHDHHSLSIKNPPAKQFHVVTGGK